MTLPVLAKLADITKNRNGARSVLVTHVLSTAVDYILTIHKVFPVEAVISIPYSAESQAVALLQKEGIRVLRPRLDEVPVAANIAVIEVLQKNAAPLVVQEIGGYLADYSAGLARYEHFCGVVEDTNNGHWCYEKTEPHDIPVLSIARSPLKDIEDTLIGDAVAYSLERILREHFGRVPQGSSVGILGYGKIGTSTAIAMRGREASVRVHDIDPIRAIRARFEGFATPSLQELLSQSDLIIGCTGQQSIRADDLPHLRDHAILASGSSKQKEFDLPGFAASSLIVEDDPLVTRYCLPTGRTFYVLRQGTPVNFRDGSILGPVLDLVYSELFLAISRLASGSHKKGLWQTDGDIHKAVALAWLQTYS